MNAQIEIKEMPELNLIACSHKGPFDQIDQAYNKLMSWAGPKGLLQAKNFKTVTVYHDDPKATPIDELKQSACITSAQKVNLDEGFAHIKLPSSKCAVGHFEITENEFEAAWDSVCNWMEERGISNSNGEPYELYHNNHEEHPEKKFILDICVPVN